MSSLHLRHPEEEELLRYADGELSPRKARQVRAHLETCWQCRTELEELEGAIGACVRYRKDVLQGELPLPPAPWGDLSRGFAEIDAAGTPWTERLARFFRYPVMYPGRWIPAAAAITVICALVYQLRETPSVQAAALLKKAVAAETRAHPARRIQIRTSTRRVIQPAAQRDPAMEALFQAAHYSWEDPLSARSYSAWRDQLPEKRDEISRGEDFYRIRTTTNSGELAEATLKLRAGDLQPVESRLEFRNREWVEISVAAEPPAPAPVAAVDASRPPARRDEARPEARATLADELQVLAALHQVGADLGDPVEVTRSGGQVLVSGVGITPPRRQQIHQALNSLPNVVVRFDDPERPQYEPEPPARSGPAEADTVNSFQMLLEKEVGGRPQFERYASELLDVSDALMSRVYALRRLAQRFPPEAEATLGAGDRLLLRHLRQEHIAPLRQHAVETERLLIPVLKPLGGTAGPPRSGTPENWQSATEDLFQAARRVETLLASLLGAASGETATEELPSRLLSAAVQLKTDLAVYERLSAGGR